MEYLEDILKLFEYLNSIQTSVRSDTGRIR